MRGAAKMADEIKDIEITEESINTGVMEDDVEIGNIKISVDVVSTIAGIATTQIKGVAGMYSSFAGGIVEKIASKKNPSKGVKVEMTETSVKIDLYIVVEYGVRVPELAWEIQESVKDNVETMTGLDVEKVNIHIEGVSFVEEEPEEFKEAEQIEESAEPTVLDEGEITD